MFEVKVKLSMSDYVRKVMRATEKARETVLKRSGAYIRKVAMNSMRSVVPKSKEKSRPGQPPFARLGNLKRLIRFSYDYSTKSVVIGPVLTGSGSRVAKVLEHGGMNTFRGLDGKPKLGRYQARPYMQPALVASLKAITAHWRDAIKGE